MGIITFSPNTPIYQATPADPTGTTNTTGLMMGLAGVTTPLFSGRLLIMVAGNLTNNTGTAGNGAKAQIRYGTGAAPTNGGALAGTTAGGFVSAVLMRATASDPVPFALHAIVTGLTIGADYWIDLALAAIVAGTGQAKNLSISVTEI
jgi:hypothetical protein